MHNTARSTAGSCSGKEWASHLTISINPLRFTADPEGELAATPNRPDWSMKRTEELLSTTSLLFCIWSDGDEVGVGQ